MAKNHKSVMARGIAKYAAEAHRCSSAAYRLRNEDELREKACIRMAAHRRRLKEHDTDWQRQKERARASDQKYRQKHAEDLARKQRLRRQSEYIEKYGEQAYMERSVQDETAHQEKATAIAQEVAADEEREKRQEALMNWTQEWAARSCASQSRSIALDAVGRSHHMS
ncbi:hypothetical protein B0H14DRAFT_2617084 [Mycena olivaceomarginata]|nr:hypothetical protein B0H14DRAFT_2617084 [Mycena olivaceomarginata]